MLNDLRKELEELYQSLLELKSVRGYRSEIRAGIRAYWNGTINYVDFLSHMKSAIRRGFHQAWIDGAKKCGIAYEELTRTELNKLRAEIEREYTFIPGLATFIEENKRGEGLLRTVYYRADIWINAYTRVQNLAQVMACKDQKLVWTLHPAEHCRSCLKLSGKIKRASYWKEKGVHPKSWDKLECRQGCKCSLEPTNEPLSKGPLPGLP